MHRSLQNAGLSRVLGDGWLSLTFSLALIAVPGMSHSEVWEFLDRSMFFVHEGTKTQIVFSETH